jgi:hypothetical protein
MPLPILDAVVQAHPSRVQAAQRPELVERQAARRRQLAERQVGVQRREQVGRQVAVQRREQAGRQAAAQQPEVAGWPVFRNHKSRLMCRRSG